MRITELLAKWQEADTSAKSQQRIANALLQQLKDGIKTGLSTGDTVLDYYILAFNGNNPAAETKLREFANELQSKANELILLITEIISDDEFDSDGGGFGSSGFVESHYDLALSVIKPGNWQFSKSLDLILPTEKTVQFADVRSPSEVKSEPLVLESFIIAALFHLDTTNPFTYRRSSHTASHSLVIGDANFMDWLNRQLAQYSPARRQEQLLHYAATARALGHDLSTLPLLLQAEK